MEIGYIQIYDDLHLPIIKICVLYGFCKACFNSAIPEAVVIMVVRVVVIIKDAEQKQGQQQWQPHDNRTDGWSSILSNRVVRLFLQSCYVKYWETSSYTEIVNYFIRHIKWLNDYSEIIFIRFAASLASVISSM